MDIQAALRDGYTEDEIAQEIGRRSGMNTKAAMRDGYSLEEIQSEASRRKPASEYRGDTSGRSVKDLQREFILSQGGFKDIAKQRMQDAIPYIRPTVEGLGAAGGAIIGSGAAPIAGTIAGGALGYAGAKNIMDTLEGKWAQSPQEAVTRAATDIGTGAMFEMGGQAAGNLIKRGIEAAPSAIRMIKNPITATAENRALKTLNANSELTAQEAANQSKSQIIADRLGIKLTPGQMSGKPAQTVMEGNLAMNDPAFKATLDAQDSAARQTALDRIKKGIGTAQPVPLTQDLQTTGRGINEALDAAEVPVRAAESEAWGKVPTYEMPHNNLQAMKKELSGATIPKSSQQAVQEIIDFAESTPKTVQGLQSIERTVGRASRKASVAGDEETAHWLNKFKTSITEDFNAMGAAADAGDIATHNGKIVYPSQLRQEMQQLEENISKASVMEAPLKERNMDLFKYLHSKGETVMQNNGVSDLMYEKSLSDRLAYLQKKGIGTDYVPPTKAGGNSAVIDNWKQGISQRKAILEGSAKNVTDKGREIATKMDEFNNPRKPRNTFVDGDLEKLMGQQDEWSAFIDSIPETNGLKTPTGYGQAILHKSTKKPGAWQISRFTREGEALGDSEFQTFREGIQDLSHETARKHEFLNGLDNSPNLKTGGVQPADNVAEAYRAAKATSKARFEQFDRGATKRVNALGNEYSGGRITDSNTARQFFTPEGADDLIRAVGGDQQAAKKLMQPFVIADMTKAAAPNGEKFSIQSGLNYINKNKPQLEKLGLMEDARQLLKSQFPTEMNEILAKTAPDSTGKQLFTPQQMRTALAKYGRTIKTLYGEETLQSFRDYNDLMMMIDRKNIVSRGGNSNTADKAVNMANSLIKSAEGPARELTDGLMTAIAKGAIGGGGIGTVTGSTGGGGAIGAMLGGGNQLFNNATKKSAQTFVKIMQDAVLDQNTRNSLVELQRTGRTPQYLQTLIDRHIPTGTAAGLLSFSGGE